MLFFKKRKKRQKEEFMSSDLNNDEDYRLIREATKADKTFREIEEMQYIRTQCEQVAESSKYISELKRENTVVESYITDIQKIESLPDELRNGIRKYSEEVTRLEKKRNDFHDKSKTLSKERYCRFEQYEEEFPKALTNLQNDEKYCNAVKHDMRILEAEKISLKEDMDTYSKRETGVRNLAIILLFSMVIISTIFVVSGIMGTETGKTIFMVVLAIAVLIVASVFALQRNSLYQFRLAEKKLARTITLLNKVKIKYVNIYNSVDYQCAKYGVKNSYQLSREYEAYLGDKKAAERYRSSTIELDDAMLGLNKVLSALNLYDASVWESHVSALSNDKEMKEIKKGLESRRKKLKEQIEYNIERISSAKKGVIAYIKKHPERSREIMEIVDSYDVEMDDE